MFGAKPCCLTRPIASIVYKDELSLREPADEASQQKPREVRRGLMTLPMGLIPLRKAVQCHYDGQCPRTCGAGQGDEDREHYPFMAPAIGGIGVGGPYTITMSAFAKDLWARVLSNRIIASEEHMAGRNYMGQEKHPQCSGQIPGRPLASGKDTMIRRHVP